MTLQKSEYLIPTNNILVLHLHLNLIPNLALLAGFNSIYWLFGMGLLFIGPPCSLLIWWTQHLSRRR